MELYSLYNTLLSFSEHDPSKFIQGLEAHLNYQRITVKTELLKRHIKESKNLSFEQFIKIYKKIEDLVYIQSVVDYVEIIFESNGMKELKIEEIKDTFMKRCSKEKAIEISEEMFLRMNRGKGATITISEVYTLCEKDTEFCSKLAELYYR